LNGSKNLPRMANSKRARADEAGDGSVHRALQGASAGTGWRAQARAIDDARATDSGPEEGQIEEEEKATKASKKRRRSKHHHRAFKQAPLLMKFVAGALHKMWHGAIQAARSDIVLINWWTSQGEALFVDSIHAQNRNATAAWLDDGACRDHPAPDHEGRSLSRFIETLGMLPNSEHTQGDTFVDVRAEVLKLNVARKRTSGAAVQHLQDSPEQPTTTGIKVSDAQQSEQHNAWDTGQEREQETSQHPAAAEAAGAHAEAGGAHTIGRKQNEGDAAEGSLQSFKDGTSLVRERPIPTDDDSKPLEKWRDPECDTWPWYFNVVEK